MHEAENVWQTPNFVINEGLSKKPFDNPFKYPDEIAFKATSNDAIRYETTLDVEIWSWGELSEMKLRFDSLKLTILIYKYIRSR